PCVFFFQAEDGIRDATVTGVQTCALPILNLLRDVAREYGVAVILLHHTTKSGEGFRGSGAIGATIEGVFVLDRPDELDDAAARRSEERRVGKEWSSGAAAEGGGGSAGRAG